MICWITFCLALFDTGPCSLDSGVVYTGAGVYLRSARKTSRSTETSWMGRIGKAIPPPDPLSGPCFDGEAFCAHTCYPVSAEIGHWQCHLNSGLCVVRVWCTT